MTECENGSTAESRRRERKMSDGKKNCCAHGPTDGAGGRDKILIEIRHHKSKGTIQRKLNTVLYCKGQEF